MIKILNLATKKGLPLFGRLFEEHLNSWVSVYMKSNNEKQRSKIKSTHAIKTMISRA